jgi:FkbM family methyltransferase
MAESLPGVVSVGNEQGICSLLLFLVGFVCMCLLQHPKVVLSVARVSDTGRTIGGPRQSVSLRESRPLCLDGLDRSKPLLQLVREAQYIVAFRGVLFHVPFYPRDGIQHDIVHLAGFYEEEILNSLAYCVPEGSVVLDIGSNIGNHAIYWAAKRRALKVYAFEPVPSTYAILRRNVEINGLQNHIVTYNVAVSDTYDNLSISRYSPRNIGGTNLQKISHGNIPAISLDSFVPAERRCDFMKIDVEGFERNVLIGGRQFFAQMRPKFVFIEVFTLKGQWGINETLKLFGYTMCETFVDSNFLYRLNA